MSSLTTAYAITFNGFVNVKYIRKTKKEAILSLRLDDSDRMSWNYHKKNGAGCVKIIIKKSK
ncbi:MAG TPA: hypothetical protein PLN38_15110 [Chitinophagales bacterium]|nr:hypothetical protein [Chitinophagales bacterium]